MQAARGIVLLIVRHGPAEPAGARGDAARRLTSEGRARVARAGSELARRVPRPRAIWSSPLVRARETAALLARPWGCAAPQATPLLEPGFDLQALADALPGADRAPLVLVGHAPDVSRLAEWLLGAHGRGRIAFGSGTAALVSFLSPGAGVLHALYPLQTFAPPISG